MNKFKTDFHNHTNLSVCAWKEMTVESIVRKFEECGLEQAGLSDHLYAEDNIPEKVKLTKKAIEMAKPSLEVFVGAEVDMIYPGGLLVKNEALKEFDFVMIACTHYHLKHLITPPMYFDYKTVAQNMVDYMTAAASMDYVDIIAHPFRADGLKVYREDFDLAEAINTIPDKDMKFLAKVLKKNEVAPELNTSLIDDAYAGAMYRFYKYCKEEGVKFSLGSDAHWLDSMYEIPKIHGYMQSLGITQEDIWTCR